MSESMPRRLFGYVARFTVVHVLVYTFVATLVLLIQGALPQPTRVALEIFALYRAPGIVETSGQVIRAVILALVLYPAYEAIVEGKRAFLVLFGALWGIVHIGSVAPMPGSIEGLIYTETPLLAHGIGLAAVALEVLLFTWLFLRWEKVAAVRSNQEMKGSVYHG